MLRDSITAAGSPAVFRDVNMLNMSITISGTTLRDDFPDGGGR
jgi:hypothetical protein